MTLKKVHYKEFDEDLRCNVQVKFSQIDHSAIANLANEYADGYMALMIRKMCKEWMSEYDNLSLLDTSKMSPKCRKAVMDAQREERKKVKLEIARDYATLEEDPDPAYEQTLKELSEKYSLPWPPDLVPASEADRKLRRVMRYVNSQCDANSGQTTFRDLQRALGKMSALELRVLVKQLEKNGEVLLEGDLAEHETTVIYLPQVRQEAIGVSQ